MTSKLEEAEKAHHDKVYEETGDPHSACSEAEGFTKGAKWLISEIEQMRPVNCSVNVNTGHAQKIFYLDDLKKLTEG